MGRFKGDADIVRLVRRRCNDDGADPNFWGCHRGQSLLMLIGKRPREPRGAHVKRLRIKVTRLSGQKKGNEGVKNPLPTGDELPTNGFGIGDAYK